LIALSAIHELGADEAVAPLLEAAKDSEENIRAAAVDLLSQRSGAAASKALVELLDRPEVSDAALAALARPAEGRIPLLFSVLEHADEDRARQITAALARMKRPEAVHAVFHALGLANVAARKAAAITLAALGGKEELAAVRHAAKEDQDPEVRRLCAVLAA
jgi:HEAT repeat protein